MNFEKFTNCRLCPRNCEINRHKEARGYCNTGTGYPVASVVRHFGEEPPISGDKGICNVFFAHCNLRCIYCQNHQISRCNTGIDYEIREINEVISQIVPHLDAGVSSVGFVSPSHCIPQMLEIIHKLRQAGYSPVFIMNTNAYDKAATIAAMEGYIDVYLPDYKYSDPRLSGKLSGAADYPEVALLSLKEMLRQKGTTLRYDDVYATSGMIIRHLVLPGFIENSIRVLENIADHLSADIHISLMSQYYPISDISAYPSLNRTLTEKEYGMVTSKLEELGFYRGWVQELDSHNTYRPDFRKEKPFGD